MILEENKFGYDPDNYDDEPSDYVNSDNTYNADDLSITNAEEFEEDDSVVEGGGDEDFVDDEDPEVDYDEDDNNVSEDDPINDDVTEYPPSQPAAFHTEGKKQVYIKDMPYIDHATPGVTSH